MNHSAPKILYTASSSAHLVSFHLPYLAALRSLGRTTMPVVAIVGTVADASNCGAEVINDD